MKFRQRILFALIIFLLAESALASNYSFLYNSSLSYFTVQDKNLMMANMMTVLNRAPDGKKLSWKNPKTSAWGYAVAMHTAKRNGTLCRSIQLFNSAHQVTGEATYTMCKINRQWKILN